MGHEKSLNVGSKKLFRRAIFQDAYFEPARSVGLVGQDCRRSVKSESVRGVDG